MTIIDVTYQCSEKNVMQAVFAYDSSNIFDVPRYALNVSQILSNKDSHANKSITISLFS